MKHVDIVIPTVGRSTVLRAVESVLAQTVPSLPIVVVAGGAPDVERDSRLRDLGAMVIDQGPRTASEARNLGLSAATAEVVGFLDDDDLFAPAKVERQLAAAPLSGEWFGTTDTVLQGEDGRSRIVPGKPYRHPMNPWSYVHARPRPRYGHHFMQTSAYLGSTSLFRREPWDVELRKWEDWELACRILTDDAVAYCHVAEPLTVVHQASPGSLSKSFDPGAAFAYLARSPIPRRARNDFLLYEVIRPALAHREWRVIAQAAGRMSLAAPHVGAVVAAMSGVLR